MSVLINVHVTEKCWNHYDSYGEICIGCGCCSIDKLTRYKARIACLERWIDENEHFDSWADEPSLRKIQEENVRENARLYKKKLRYYRKNLANLEAVEG